MKTLKNPPTDCMSCECSLAEIGVLFYQPHDTWGGCKCPSCANDEGEMYELIDDRWVSFKIIRILKR